MNKKKKSKTEISSGEKIFIGALCVVVAFGAVQFVRTVANGADPFETAESEDDEVTEILGASQETEEVTDEVEPESTTISLNQLNSASEVVSAIDALASSSSEIISTENYQMSEEVYNALWYGIEQIESQGYSCGFVLTDIESGESITYNADGIYYSASSIKAFYVASVVAADNSTAYGGLAYSMQNALIWSDNNAYENLIYAYGEDPMWTYFANANVTSASYRWDIFPRMYPDISVRDMAKMWALNYELFTTTDAGATIAQWYTTPNYCSLKDYVNEGDITYTKAGWIYDSDSTGIYSATNDGGIIISNGRAFLVQLMTSCPANFDIISSLSEGLVQAQQEMCAQFSIN